MDRYITFVACSVFDLKDQLNKNAADGYVLALMEIQVDCYSSSGTSVTQYIVIMEHQPVQHTTLASDEKFPPFNVKSGKKEGERNN